MKPFVASSLRRELSKGILATNSHLSTVQSSCAFSITSAAVVQSSTFTAPLYLNGAPFTKYAMFINCKMFMIFDNYRRTIIFN